MRISKSTLIILFITLSLILSFSFGEQVKGKLAIAKYGTPKIDGEMDEIWKSTEEYLTDSYVQGTKGKVAYAKFRVLWDETSIYVYAEVFDSLLNKENSNPWEQDSIEIFIDENNSKGSSYDSDDAQYRVCLLYTSPSPRD